MTPPAHLSAGYLVYRYFSHTSGIEEYPLLIAAIIGALAPDIDGLFGSQMKNHRDTVFHAPFFWVCIHLLFFVLFQILGHNNAILYIHAFFVGVYTHFFLDWFASRTSGVRLFYPFSKRRFSLFLLHPEKGRVPVFPRKGQISDWINFWKFYFENKFLIFFEIIIIFSPLVFSLQN